jgi:shikimate kinase
VRTDKIYLVGFMGAGKSTVGPLVAQALGWAFRDLDAWIEAAAGRTVAEIFAAEGEPAFRARELEAARAAAGLRHHVIAAGGGAFAQEETRRMLCAGAVTVWLQCAEAALLARLPEDGRRPLAVNRERMRAILTAREPFYRLADVAVDTTSLAPEAVARRVVEAARARVGTDQKGPSET